MVPPGQPVTRGRSGRDSEVVNDRNEAWLRDFLVQTDRFTVVRTIPERYQLMIREQELAMGGDHQTVAEHWDAIADHARAIAEAAATAAATANKISALIRQYGAPPPHA
jgi:hypothetical protein